ncbi:unnamed protein product, partial [Porites evermanni]
IASSKLSSSSGEQRARAETERVSGRLGRPRPGDLASLSGAHSPVSSALACLYDWTNLKHSNHFLFFFKLLLLLLEYQARASAGERGEGHQKEKREMTGLRSLRFSALCLLASLTARRE